MHQNVCLFPREISTIIAFSSKLGCSCRAYVFVYSLERKDRVAPLLTFKLTIVQLLQLKDYERIRASDKKFAISYFGPRTMKSRNFITTKITPLREENNGIINEQKLSLWYGIIHLLRLQNFPKN